MRLEDLGIDVKTGAHKKSPLTCLESAFLGVIWVDHVGEHKALPARAFALRLRHKISMPGGMEQWKRAVRLIQNHVLFDHNIPVLSKAGHKGGYWIAENKLEANAFYESFRQRGLTGLVKASRGKQSAMVDMVTQLSFKFEEMVDKTLSATARPRADVPTPIEVVDAFFERMLRDPEQYADGLRKIGDKYGSVLVPKSRFDAMIGAMKAKTVELQELVTSLEN